MKTRLRQLRFMFRNFRRSDAGTVLPLIGLMSLMLIGCIGIAIDVGRAVVVRARLVDALDSAGLAVASRISAVDINAEAQKFVAANFVANFAGATVSNVVATQNADKSVVTVTATATMPTAFMQLFGSDTVTVNATSEVTRAMAGLELVMVLDNTGSMADSGSMPGLKAAANLLLDQVFGTQATAKNLYVGLVPFSQAVNIGTSASRKDWVTDTSLLHSTNPHYPAHWTGCVEARRNGLDQTDDPPGATPAGAEFTAYYSRDTSSNNWIRGFSWRPRLEIDYSNRRAPQGPGAYCPSEVTPMTNVKSKIQAGVTAMTAAGSTMINEGAVWGWRMISPRWRGLWDGDMAAHSLPLAYGTRNMEKAVVIMTDGENSFNRNNYTAYGELDDRRLGTSVEADANDILDARLTAVCDGMKAAGVNVFTVAFDDPDASTKTMMQGCASGMSNYFDAGSQDELKAAFKTIGDSLSNLRVSR